MVEDVVYVVVDRAGGPHGHPGHHPPPHLHQVQLYCQGSFSHR